MRVDCLVVGSGPGASVAALHLVESGRDVLMLEEGRDGRRAPTPPYSQAEIIGKYKNAGITPALGRPRVNYAEGSCFGGGSEVNSGLYHRAPRIVLERWRNEYAVRGLRDEALDPHYEWLEEVVGVSRLPGEASRASVMLKEGAEALGWESQEVPRFYSYGPEGRKNSMSQTLLPRYLEQGGQLACPASVQRFKRSGEKWSVRCTTPDGPLEIECRNLFLGAGSIGTPFLLRRSGIRRRSGDSLKLHPMLKVVAEFPEPVNEPGMGVGVHQVREFSPDMSFGCSISSLPFLAIGLIDYPDELARLRASWPFMAQYYAQVCGDSYGTVRAVPLVDSPFVRYHLSKRDGNALATALSRLSQALLEAGAVGVFPNVRGMLPIRSREELARIPTELSRKNVELVAVHLVGSCPMGEDPSKCATDSFGRVWGQDGLFLVDGSVLCTAPGVNPQGTIMAVARRNILHFIEAD